MGGPGSLKGKIIAVLGLAFKLNTDDMREAPAITICEGLVQRGAQLRAFDPAAIKEASWRLPGLISAGRLSFAADEYDAARGAHALVIVTEWNQCRKLDLERIKAGMANSGNGAFFFDLRNIYKRSEAETAGFTYFGVGQ
jgi:UDPglucose 6-dehydrogenase